MFILTKIKKIINLRKKVLKFILAFGFFSGLKIVYQIGFSNKNPIIKLKIPQLKHFIYLRKGTSDIDVFEEIFITKIYKKLSALKSCNTVIDAGANIGLFTLYLLVKYPKANFYCIEPEESNFNLLKKNTQNYANIHIFKNGLWHSNSYLKFKDLGVSHWAFQLVESTENDYDIHGITVNNLIEKFKLTNIDIVKIDIEGSEKEVFEMHTNWLTIVKNLMIETHEDMRAGSKLAVINSLDAHSFKNTNQNSNYFFYK